jgi:hypothetical protein
VLQHSAETPLRKAGAAVIAESTIQQVNDIDAPELGFIQSRS